MAKLYRLVADYRGNSVQLTSYRRGARGRLIRNGTLSLPREEVRGLPQNPEAAKVLLFPQSK